MKKLLLRILQYLQETPVLQFLYHEIAGLKASRFIKMRLNTGVF